MIQETAQDLNDIIRIIANTNYAAGSGPVVAKITLWNGTRVFGTRYECDEEEIDVSNSGYLLNAYNLAPFAGKLFHEGKSFVTSTGGNKARCILKWTLQRESRLTVA